MLNLFALGLHLILLATSEEFDMLVLECLVHAALIQLGTLTHLLLLHLLVKFGTDQLAALLLAENGLLLLLIVQQSVEFLDGGPLILLSELRINLSASVNLT